MRNDNGGVDVLLEPASDEKGLEEIRTSLKSQSSPVKYNFYLDRYTEIL
jgi:hypothetical protein